MADDGYGIVWRESSETAPDIKLRRAWRLDVAAGLLLALAVLAGVSLASNDPLDAPGATAPARPVANLLGKPGALFAQEVASALGCASWTLLTTWLSVVALLVFRRRWGRWTLAGVLTPRAVINLKLA